MSDDKCACGEWTEAAWKRYGGKFEDGTLLEEHSDRASFDPDFAGCPGDCAAEWHDDNDPRLSALGDFPGTDVCGCMRAST